MHHQIIARELNLSPRDVAATLALLDEGATIPFIARYRKEQTGSLDEVQIAAIRDRAEQLRALDDRRASILKSLEERNLLSDDLRKSVEGAKTMSELEDIYLPYRPKRRTRATIAREKGLEPLALLLLEQRPSTKPDEAAQPFISAEKGVNDLNEALAGARDIIAEMVSEDKDARAAMRNLYNRKAWIVSKLIKGKEEEGAKYRDYFDWKEPIDKIPSHRLLAMRRGEKELILSLSIEPEEEDAVQLLERQFVKGRSAASNEVIEAIRDGYKRLLGPGMETEVRLASKDKADVDAIRVFTDNVRQLLLAAPMGQKRILALDPGFRTGCKVVILNEQGKLLENDVIYPHPPQHQSAQASVMIAGLVKEYKIEAIAIGNGTASRETEEFVQRIGLPREVQVVMVNESGASVYSASDVAREEFPDHDVTVRGAVSIGRRLQDPLAELVKIDPKSIGVGQYQHDVEQSQLKKSLDDTVISCVNAVGVEVNTASKELLSYVSGLGPALAKNIVEYRNENGPFKTRKELLKVKRLGDKAFEQAAGFLRIRGGAHPLDGSAVHPERYSLVEQMAADLGCTVADLMKQDNLRKQLNLSRYVSESVGMPTLTDIMAELAKPGRDPREQFESFSFAEGIKEISDLHEGMTLPGIVTNITDFGAFVDIGVHQDGLVHISEMANRRISHPGEVVKLQQRVQVRVISVDYSRKRIALSMKEQGYNRPPQRQERPRQEQAPKESEFMRFGKLKK